MQNLEELANWTTDQDLPWWPFAFLRPEPHVPMTSARVLAMSLLYGVFAGLFMNVVTRIGGSAPGLPAWVLPLTGTAGFFAMFRTTFAVAWNRRAERMEPRR